MKKVTLYQTRNDEAFLQNMRARFTEDYVPLHEMESVVMLRMSGDDSYILEELFYRMNSNEYFYSLNYSMSVGDIVDIAGNLYRCLPIGWDVIQK